MSLGNPEPSAMERTVSAEAVLPREREVQLLADSAQLSKRLRGLVLHEPLTGVYGQGGTKARVVMQKGKKKMECAGTITRQEPSDLLRAPKGHVVHFDRQIADEGTWAQCVTG